MQQHPMDNVSMHDIYARLLSIEDRLIDNAVELASIKAGLNGPKPLRSRVESLERRWARLLGAIFVLGFLVSGIGALSFLFK